MAAVYALCSCGQSEDTAKTFTIKGCVVTSPSNLPLSGVIVRVMNDSYTLASTSSAADGSFAITVDKSKIDASYHLSLYEADLDISKDVTLTGFGLEVYDMGNIIFYDSRNPKDLPSIVSSGVTYVIHPPLSNSLSYTEAVSACAALSDYGLGDWFLPNKDVLSSALWSKYYSHYVSGTYWSSSEDERGYQIIVVFVNSAELMESFTRSTNNLDAKYYVLPVHLY